MIRLGGDYIERFLNMCRMHDINLWGIKRENNICMCEAYASDFLKMPPLLKKTSTKAHVLKKKGLFFLQVLLSVWECSTMSQIMSGQLNM